MTIHYNRQSEREKRRSLRSNMTPAEKIAWGYLRRRQLKYKFLRQYSVDKFIIDFYCPELKLAIEIDGSIHDVPENKDRDEGRQNYLERFGIKFMRTRNDEWFTMPESVLNRIKEEIKIRKQNLQLPAKAPISIPE